MLSKWGFSKNRVIPVIPIIYGSLMSWKEESQIFSDQIFHQIEDPLMFQKDSETVESRLKFAPSNGFTQKCPVRPGNIFFRGVSMEIFVSPAALGPHGQFPLQPKDRSDT